MSEIQPSGIKSYNLYYFLYWSFLCWYLRILREKKFLIFNFAQCKAPKSKKEYFVLFFFLSYITYSHNSTPIPSPFWLHGGKAGLLWPTRPQRDFPSCSPRALLGVQSSTYEDYECPGPLRKQVVQSNSNGPEERLRADIVNTNQQTGKSPPYSRHKQARRALCT